MATTSQKGQLLLSIACSLFAVSALADDEPVPTQADVRTIADKLWSGGCYGAHAIARFLATPDAGRNDMLKAQEAVLAASPVIRKSEDTPVMPVDLPGYLKALAGRAKESVTEGEAVQIELLALADASSVYLRGGRDFSDGTTAVFVGGSSDPRGDFEKARQEFVSAADQAGIHLGRKSCTEWLKRNP